MILTNFNKFVKDNIQLLQEIESGLLTFGINGPIVEDIMNGLLKKTYLQKKEIIGREDLISALDSILKSRIEPYSRIVSLDDAQNDEMEVILLCGINGSGKTSASIKIAKLLNRLDWRISIASCDTYKPGASDLYLKEIKSSDVPIFTQNEIDKTPYAVAKRALDASIKQKKDVLIIDTGGRMGVNSDLLSELKKIKQLAEKEAVLKNVIFALDMSLGSGSLKNLSYFCNIIGITGLIATKADITSKNFGIILSACETNNIFIHGYSNSSSNDTIHEFTPKLFSEVILSGLLNGISFIN